MEAERGTMNRRTDTDATTGGPISPTRSQLSRELADFFDAHLEYTMHLEEEQYGT